MVKSIIKINNLYISGIKISNKNYNNFGNIYLHENKEILDLQKNKFKIFESKTNIMNIVNFIFSRLEDLEFKNNKLKIEIIINK